MHSVQFVITYRFNTLLMLLVVLSALQCAAQTTYISAGGGFHFKKYFLSDVERSLLYSSFMNKKSTEEYIVSKTCDITEICESVAFDVDCVGKHYQESARTTDYFLKMGIGRALSSYFRIELDYIFFLIKAIFVILLFSSLTLQKI